MPRNDIPIARFPLPGDWSPEGVWCARVPIPADSEYLATLTGVIDILRHSDAFARDDTKSGASQVAGAWRVALESQPILIIDCEDGMEFRLRQNPSNKCQLQQSIDGGETWTLAFDYALCKGPIVPNIPPYPDAPAGARDAAANAITNIFQGLLNLNPDCEMSRSEYIGLATDYLRGFDTAFSIPTALGGVYDAYCALSPEDREAARDNCYWKEHFQDIVSCYDAGGLINDLNCLSDAIGNWLSTASGDLGINLNAVAGALGLGGWQNASNSYAGSGAGGGGGAGGFGKGGGFDAECADWCYEIDYTTTPGDDFPGLDFVPTNAEWIDGEGWHNTDQQMLLYYFCNPLNFSMKFMEMDFISNVTQWFNAGERCQLGTSWGIWAGGPDSDWNLQGGEHIVGGGTLTGAHAPIGVSHFFINLQGWTSVFPTVVAGDFTVSRLKICGDGANPFVS